MNKGLERHKRQSELLARQSLMDFGNINGKVMKRFCMSGFIEGLPVSNGTAQNVSQVNDQCVYEVSWCCRCRYIRGFFNRVGYQCAIIDQMIEWSIDDD